MAYAGRPARVAPLFVGATAGTLVALDRVGRLDDALVNGQLTWLLERQTSSGAFDTAVGFGRGCVPPRQQDWRDSVPVCGWADKVYAFLARLVVDPVPVGVNAPVQKSVLVRGQVAEFTEDACTLAVRSGKQEWYVWRKRTVWPDVCRL